MTSEKEAFVQTWEREFQTTIKVLNYFPQEKGSFKPAEKTRTATELAWVFTQEMEVLVDGAVNGRIEFDKLRPAPATMAEAISAFETVFPKILDRVRKMSDTDWNAEMDFFVAPKQMGKVRRGAILWFMLYDSIHHRGQFTIYSRMVGAKVPSIYGPSADEPWM